MDFDTVIDRHGTHASKWDAMEKRYPDQDVLPLWIADMDFSVADGIQEALRQRVEHPIYGYTEGKEEVVEGFVKHFNERHRHNFDKDHVLLVTGVIHAMKAAVACFSQQSDAIMVNSPVYPPFYEVIKVNGRRIVDVPMQINEERVEFDFEAMEKASSCTMLLLCNPQNPSGRNFTQAELEKLADFVERHHMIVVADEIHADFLYGEKFIPFSEINEYTKSHTITCVSCTKSFNIAGLKIAALMIHDEAMLAKMKTIVQLYSLNSINLFALTAAKAAYETGETWLDELLAYLQANRDFGITFMRTHLTKAKVFSSEATMFLWVDMEGYGIEHLQAKLAQEAGVCLDDGARFSKTCPYYVRINIGCPRSILQEALLRMKNYLDAFQ